MIYVLNKIKGFGVYFDIFVIMNKIILYFLCFGFTTFLNAQNVKSILLRPANNPKQYNSIVKLGNVLELSFDDLDLIIKTIIIK